MDANALQCEIVSYTYEQLEGDGITLYQFLDTGEVDLILDNNIESLTDEYRIVTSFDSQPHYIVTSIGNQEILDGLNMALEKICDSNPSFAAETYYANFPYMSFTDIQLSEEDLAYIEKNKSVTVAVPNDWHPLFCMDINDNHDGLLPDLLEKVQDFTGFDFSYVYCDSYVDAVHLVQQGDADILGFFLGSEKDAQSMDLVLTQEYGAIGNIVIRNKSVNYPSSGLSSAVLEGRTLPDNIKSSHISYYTSSTEALSAVNKGDIDFVYGLSSHLEKDMQNHFYSNLVPMNLADDYSHISFALKRPADTSLLSILNKAVNQISKQEKASLLDQNMVSTGSRKITLLELVYGNPMAFIIIITIILLSVVAIILMISRSRIRAAIIQGDLERAQAESKAKGEFLSRMSHEIRTPMNAVVGLSDLTCMMEGLPKEVQENLSKIRSSSRYLLDLINNILDMSRIDNGKMTVAAEEPFSLIHMLEEIHDMMTAEAEKRKLTFLFEPTLPHDVFTGDEIRLRQVLMNLMSNALKFTPEGGRITLAAKETECTPEGAFLTFRVIDTGCGIPQADQMRIFEAFEQVGSNLSKSQGTGLGLPISSNIVRLMGGELHLKSEEGKGSEFYFTIPLPFGTLPEQPKSCSSPALLTGMQLLLAEDNDLNAEITSKLLEKRGASIQRASDGNQAVELFRTSAPGTFDAILMDVQMPVLNGLDATRKIRSLSHPDAAAIPIFAISASSFKEDAEAALEAGMTAFLSKPLDISQLYQILGNIRS